MLYTSFSNLKSVFMQCLQKTYSPDSPQCGKSFYFEAKKDGFSKLS